MVRIPVSAYKNETHTAPIVKTKVAFLTYITHSKLIIKIVLIELMTIEY